LEGQSVERRGPKMTSISRREKISEMTSNERTRGRIGGQNRRVRRGHNSGGQGDKVN
jgi:hypothetical protein